MPGPIARPLMKGHFWNWFKWNVPFVCSGAAAVGVAYNYLIGERRKKIYREFYQKYDPEKEEAEMISLGYFNAINARGEINKEVYE